MSKGSPLHSCLSAVITISVLALLTGCMSVAPYQRAMLNGEDMEMSMPTVQTFEGNIQTYREGASGANGGKIGGGCGCN